MFGRIDQISIAGIIALGFIVAGLSMIYKFTPVPPRSSFFGYITGYLLVAAMVILWGLPVFSRRGLPTNRETYKTIHRIIGLMFVLLLALHARSAGHGILFGLMASTLVMAFLAFLNPRIQVAPKPKQWPLFAWWSIHVGLAAAISTLAIAHIVAQYAYAT